MDNILCSLLTPMKFYVESKLKINTTIEKKLSQDFLNILLHQ